MTTLASWFLSTTAVLLAIPTTVFLIEILAAVFLAKRSTVVEDDGLGRGTVAVLLPAHNESGILRPTLDDIKGQLRPGDRLVVVADNCTDDTAAIAGSSGAEITERSDPTRIGKGYALDWGLRYLADNPPETVIMIDADCRISPGTLDQLAALSGKTQRPVQALYLMTAPTGSGINHQVAEFAWRLKNWVRPLGLNNLGLPCQLMGSGMAFPWNIIHTAEFASGHIVEDLKLGIEFAGVGHPPLFCPSAVVTSHFPTSAQGAEMQRHRWEQGQIGLVLKLAPMLFYRSAKDRNLGLFALTLNLCVPPISLFILVSVTIVFLSAAAALAGLSALAFVVSSACVATLVAGAGLAWFNRGRDILPLRSFVLIANYTFVKLRMYKAVILGQRISHWIRADRS